MSEEAANRHGQPAVAPEGEAASAGGAQIIDLHPGDGAIANSAGIARLVDLTPAVHPIRGTTHDGLDKKGSMDEAGADAPGFVHPNGEVEYPGRNEAYVVPHDVYAQNVASLAATSQQGHEHEQQQQQQSQPQSHAHGEETPKSYAREQLQPSRSYINDPASRPVTIAGAADLARAPSQSQPQAVAHQQQVQQPISQDYAGQQQLEQDPYRQSYRQSQFVEGVPAIAVSGQPYQAPAPPQQVHDQNQYGYPQQQQFQQQPLQQYQQEVPLQQQQQNHNVPAVLPIPLPGADVQRNASVATNATRTSTVGPTTHVQPLNDTPLQNGPYDAESRPIQGGGLGAALATTGHDLTRGDKKNLKNEIKNEKKFAKALAAEAAGESEDIKKALRIAEVSRKAARKSGERELAFRKPYEKAIKAEVKAKEHLLKVTAEYNKIAAELEKATKEMEIRRNQHIADEQTRDADAEKVDQLRKLKGQHDMEREAKVGNSQVKVNQAKRTLSTSKRGSKLF